MFSDANTAVVKPINRNPTSDKPIIFFIFCCLLFLDTLSIRRRSEELMKMKRKKWSVVK
jgi:hypothetical protein